MRMSKLSEAVELWRRGALGDVVAATLEMTPAAFRGFAHRNRDLFPHRRHGAEWWAAAIEPYEGLSAAEAGRRMGVPEHTVRYWRRKLAETRRDTASRAEGATK